MNVAIPSTEVLGYFQLVRSRDEIEVIVLPARGMRAPESFYIAMKGQERDFLAN